MSTWHVDDTELTAYARRQLAPLQRASVEAHVGACPACRDVLTRVVAGSAGTVVFDSLWDRVQLGVEHAPAARPTRWLRRFGVAEPDTVVVRQIGRQSLQWTIATTMMLVVAALAAALGVSDSTQAGFVALAPLLPPLGVAATFRATPPSTAVLEATSPLSPARLLLWRTAYVVATAIPSSVVLGAIIPGDVWLAVAWLLPSAACTAIVLVAATWTDPLVPAVSVSAGWIVLVVVWGLRDLGASMTAPPTQLVSLAVATLAGAVFARRLTVLRPPVH